MGALMEALPCENCPAPRVSPAHPAHPQSFLMMLKRKSAHGFGKHVKCINSFLGHVKPLKDPAHKKFLKVLSVMISP